MKRFKKVSTRCCPKCGYLITQKEIEQIKIVVECPRLCGTDINSFQIVDLEDEGE